MARNYHAYVNDKPYGTQLPLDTILVTDSAAGATAFSCALKTYNGAIGVHPDQKPCGTVLEAAKEIGYKTGLVVTSRITHATPASFSAHVINRNFENQIALQQIGNYTLGRRVDLMFGGGLCHFKPMGDPISCRLDNVNVLELAERSGWAVGTDKVAFDALEAETAASKLPLLNLFTRDHMSFEIDRDPKQEPSLKDMAMKAINILTKATKGKGKGFFLMIEGSRIDMAGHNNDPAAHVREILAYNEAIEAVKEYVEKHKDTTVMISVSDHETGGLSVARQLNETYPKYDWYPDALKGVQRSMEVIAPEVVAYNASDKAVWVRKTVVEGYELFVSKKPGNSNADATSVLPTTRWLNVKDATKEEIAYLLDPARDVSQITSQLGLIVSRRAELGWATHGHSAVDVNLYAHGLNSDVLRGNHENTDIGDFIIEQLGLDLGDITTKLQKVTKAAPRSRATKTVKPCVPSPSSPPAIDHAFHPPDIPLTSTLSTAEAAVAAPTASLPTSYIPFDYDTALAQLLSADPSLKRIIDSSQKPCRIFEGTDYGRGNNGLDIFRALSTAIIYQQLHGKAAASILKRFIALFSTKDDQDPNAHGGADNYADPRHHGPFPSPAAVRATERATLMTAGLSYRKAEYIHALADKFIDGTITNDKILQMSDEEIAKTLVAIKGIGPWTVDMFLMFDLKRPNILPVGDLGVQKGMSIHFNLGAKAGGGKKKSKGKAGAGGGVYLPSPDEMREAAKVWEPYRTIGSYYMWAVADVKTLEDS
ncbi:hypothetical protein HDV00_001103 [Rhizophlyctis rosea]|nr:hypothetical protein HDV00_001103 [Rhizophlyctis rosea]